MVKIHYLLSAVCVNVQKAQNTLRINFGHGGQVVQKYSGSTSNWPHRTLGHRLKVSAESMHIHGYIGIRPRVPSLCLHTFWSSNFPKLVQVSVNQSHGLIYFICRWMWARHLGSMWHMEAVVPFIHSPEAMFRAMELLHGSWSIPMADKLNIDERKCSAHLSCSNLCAILSYDSTVLPNVGW